MSVDDFMQLSADSAGHECSKEATSGFVQRGVED